MLVSGRVAFIIDQGLWLFHSHDGSMGLIYLPTNLPQTNQPFMWVNIPFVPWIRHEIVWVMAFGG